ncbi:nucleoside-diphosphate kinase [Clostridium perfringens]|uniref:Nucleoside diphosphate kinase n=1 Tax=Clostridium perfringens TaxID=1502 RepID=A0AAN5N8J0_CLOPF|nr:nucleoside-diphosphate kinase [Clostridium perfringens]AQW27516.1 nucleoside-diphosphate kinase [Clostridium perfringens]KAB8120910.1 nucleoside-diphosphate kinase [Clostridium perfringens]KQC92091.1 nucleoside diphosphate kinase [Clostridium perfringens CP4]MBO3337879.1 nucleoside-diphosphate kinase [Clostridium perfringens]MBO3383948.1 nucleoside-diphosphate kinase [Clostridium perfringens]
MRLEKSLVLIKPDAVERNLIGKILEVYEGAGLKIKAMEMKQINKEFAEKHYEEHRDKQFFNSLIKYITRSPLVALILEGEDAINKIRSLNGATNPEKAEFGTIRRRFALSGTENSVHVSDSIESAEKEIKLWFPKVFYEEICG